MSLALDEPTPADLPLDDALPFVISKMDAKGLGGVWIEHPGFLLVRPTGCALRGAPAQPRAARSKRRMVAGSARPARALARPSGTAPPGSETMR